MKPSPHHHEAKQISPCMPEQVWHIDPFKLFRLSHAIVLPRACCYKTTHLRCRFTISMPALLAPSYCKPRLVAVATQGGFCLLV